MGSLNNYETSSKSVLSLSIEPLMGEELDRIVSSITQFYI